MPVVVLDPSTAKQFEDFPERTVLSNSTGRLLGVYLPIESSQRHGLIRSPYSDEELDAIEAEPGGRTLAEIMADLEKLP